jgi:hypothetical protein
MCRTAARFLFRMRSEMFSFHRLWPNNQAAPNMTITRRESQMPLPALLRDLMVSERWRQPADDVVFAAVPFLREPVDFLLSEARMRFESQGKCVGLPHFREFRSSESQPQPLPWLDKGMPTLEKVFGLYRTTT